MVKKTSRILVTGGNGFLGRVFVENLHGKGYSDVFTFSSRECDLTLQSDAQRLFFYHNPDVVIHLAARVGGIGANQRNPGKFAYENLAMGLNVVEMCRRYSVQKTVLLGTVCAYPKHTPVPFKEEDLWAGYPEPTNAPYGVAKKALSVLANGYREQYGCNMIFLLPVNLYGPGDNFHPEDSHVIPAMIRKFHEAKINENPQVRLWGDGSPTREFLYVDDCAEAIALAMEKHDGPEAINIGNGREVSMSALASMIAGVIGYDGSILWDKSRPNGQPRRCLDVSRARRFLGWEAKTSLEEGLAKTYEWFVSQ